MAKQKKKPGKLVRIDDESWAFVEKKISSGERIGACVRRLLGLPPKGEPIEEPEERFTIPSLLFESKEEAKGEAIYRSVKEKTEIEAPVRVRKIS